MHFFWIWLIFFRKLAGKSYEDLATCVADPVGSGSFWSYPDLDVCEQIRILALVNSLICIIFIGVCKSHALQEFLFLNFLGHEYMF
jgi:hypothetical protein